MVRTILAVFLLAAAIDSLGDDQADRVVLDIQVDTGKRYDIKVDPFERSAPIRRQDSH